ncbi:hypothetical protein GCM10022631_04890 [Deinococcus rubellus]|uniref:Carboxylesterase family protein n=1 Tax=Deinococcus rubellus TaxID=1889240 RepID=A0ABY5YGH3_9DEIO|nr:carboxylesterase family protein [Deinococcus rubellus]UWX64158.1 carboxylesterase family protein [Deinococcus rubellus]
MHSSSLIYAFQTPIPGLGDPVQFSAAQRDLSDSFGGVWAAFVKTGNLNWSAFDASCANVQVFMSSGV